MENTTSTDRQYGLRQRAVAIRERLVQAGDRAATGEVDALLATLDQAAPGAAHDAALDRLADWIYEHEDEPGAAATEEGQAP